MGNSNHKSQQDRYKIYQALYQMSVQRPISPDSLPLKKPSQPFGNDQHYYASGHTTLPTSINSRGEIDNERLLYTRNNKSMDRRWKISKKNLLEYPYNLSGLVVAESRENREDRASSISYCSGTLISSNLVLTTAHSFCFINSSKDIIHCIPQQMHISSFDHQSQSITKKTYRIKDYKINSEYLIIQQKIAQKDLELINLRNILSNSDYSFFQPEANQQISCLEMKEIECDYALLQLEEKVKRTRYLPLSIIQEDKTYRGRIIGCQENVNGFFSEEISYYQHEGPIFISEQNKILYDIDTQQQQSGSSVIVGSGINQRIIGIHKGSYSKKKLNLGLLITAKIIKQLNIWTKQLGCQKFTIINSSDNMDDESHHLSRIESAQSRTQERNSFRLDQRERIEQLKQEQINQRKMLRIKQQEKYIEKSMESLKNILQIVDHKEYINFMRKKFEWNAEFSQERGFKIMGKMFRKKSNEYSQIIGLDPLPRNGKYEISFKIVNYGHQKSDIYLGIITQNRLSSKWSGGYSSYHQQSIGYLTYHHPKINKQQKGEGGIIVDGVYHTGRFKDLLPGLYIQEGKELKMEFDFDKSEITFINEIGSYTIPIPRSYYDCDLYVCASCWAKNTTIQVIE